MAPGAKSKFGTPMFEPEVFWKQMHCIEENTCDTFRTFWWPHGHLSPREFCSPSLCPCSAL